jgi:putative lipoprotein
MKFHSLFLAATGTILLMGGCKHRNDVPTEAVATADTSQIDTTTTENDSIVEEQDTIAPPKKADEFFDDFAFAFMKNRKFQRSRISFPLPYTIDGQLKHISRNAWRFDRMYSAHEVYTLIFDSHKGTKMSKDTSVRNVVVEELNLELQRVKSYRFERKSGEWMLTSLNEQPMEESVNSDFYNFYHHFATDDDFQKTHVAEPIKFSTYDEDNFQRISGTISSAQWKDFAPELPHSQLTNILYGQTYKNSKLRVLSISSLSGGMASSLTFKKKNGEWMLTQIEN